MIPHRVFIFLIQVILGMLPPAICGGAVVSSPDGIAQVTIPAGHVPILPVFVHEDIFTGRVEGVAANGAILTLTFPGTPFPPEEYTAAEYFSHYLEVIEAGPFEGMFFNIQYNTGNTLTIHTWEGEVEPVAADDQVVIRKHLTIGEYFRDGQSQLRAGVDNIKLFYPGQNWRTVFWDGRKWTTNFLNDVSAAPLYPGQGFLTAFSGERSFCVSGKVKTTPTQVPVHAGEINLVGPLSPLDRTLGELNAVAWMEAGVDSIKLFSIDGTFTHAGTYFSEGEHMTNDFASDMDSVVLRAHAACLIIPGADKNWIQPPAYAMEP